MRILFALLSGFVGLALIIGGYRLARIIIPLWGFVAGLSLGGSIISSMNSTPFLGTALGIIIGLAAGLVFAVLAYFYYGLAVVVLAGMLGYWAGSSFIQVLGFHPGLLSMLIGLALGIITGLLALFYNAPKYVLIVLTSLAGAAATVGGVMLLFNVVTLENFSFTAVQTAISNSFAWGLIALALAIVGIVIQYRTTAHYYFEKWTYGPSGRQLPPTGATGTQ